MSFRRISASSELSADERRFWGLRGPTVVALLGMFPALGGPLDMTVSNQLLTVDEVAQIFQVTRKTIYNWAGSNDSPPRVRIGNKSFFRAADIESFIEGLTSK